MTKILSRSRRSRAFVVFCSVSYLLVGRQTLFPFLFSFCLKLFYFIFCFVLSVFVFVLVFVLDTEVTFVWTLDNGTDTTGRAPSRSTSPRRRSPSPSPLRPSPLRPSVSTQPTTSVHLAQWQAEQRARDEVLVRVKGQPRVKLNRVFEVCL